VLHIDTAFAPASPNQAKVFAKELVALQPEPCWSAIRPRYSGAANRDAHDPIGVRGRFRSGGQPYCPRASRDRPAAQPASPISRHRMIGNG